MDRTLQIRSVPEEVHMAVRVRAAQAGLSVSDYLLGLISELVMQPTMAEIVERAEQLARSGGGASHDDIQAAIREARNR